MVKEYRRLPEYHLFGLRQMNIQTILDIGANTGQFVEWIRPIFPKAKIISFEPQPDVFKHLQNLAQQAENWIAVNIALGDIEGSVQMNKHTEYSPSSSILASTKLNAQLYPSSAVQEKIDVTVATLDNWSREYSTPFEKSLLIKMDVQGFESSVIRGAREVIFGADAVITEVNVKKLYENQTTFLEIVSMLSDLGFVYQSNIDCGLDSASRVISFDALFMKMD